MPQHSVADATQRQQDTPEAMLHSMSEAVARSMGSMLLRFEDRVEEKIRQEIYSSRLSGFEGERRPEGMGGVHMGSLVQAQGVGGEAARQHGEKRIDPAFFDPSSLQCSTTHGV